MQLFTFGVLSVLTSLVIHNIFLMGTADWVINFLIKAVEYTTRIKRQTTVIVTISFKTIFLQELDSYFKTHVV